MTTRTAEISPIIEIPDDWLFWLPDTKFCRLSFAQPPGVHCPACCAYVFGGTVSTRVAFGYGCKRRTVGKTCSCGCLM
jgi:hypothetical protein